MPNFKLTKEDKDYWEQATKRFTRLEDSSSKNVSLEKTQEEIEDSLKDSQQSNLDSVISSESTAGKTVLSEVDLKSYLYKKKKQAEKTSDFSSWQPLKTDFNNLKKIKQKKIIVEKVLDLHSLNEKKALSIFINFITSAYHNNHKLVLVITGKGNHSPKSPDSKDNDSDYGVLRTAFFSWLNIPQVRNYIISYSPAFIQDGGNGAFYVLIRKKVL